MQGNGYSVFDQPRVQKPRPKTLDCFGVELMSPEKLVIPVQALSSKFIGAFTNIGDEDAPAVTV